MKHRRINPPPYLSDRFRYYVPTDRSLASLSATLPSTEVRTQYLQKASYLSEVPSGVHEENVLKHTVAAFTSNVEDRLGEIVGEVKTSLTELTQPYSDSFKIFAYRLEAMVMPHSTKRLAEMAHVLELVAEANRRTVGGDPWMDIEIELMMIPVRARRTASAKIAARDYRDVPSYENFNALMAARRNLTAAELDALAEWDVYVPFHELEGATQ